MKGMLSVSLEAVLVRIDSISHLTVYGPGQCTKQSVPSDPQGCAMHMYVANDASNATSSRPGLGIARAGLHTTKQQPAQSNHLYSRQETQKNSTASPWRRSPKHAGPKEDLLTATALDALLRPRAFEVGHHQTCTACMLSWTPLADP